MYLIDTNILAYFIKQNPRVCEKFISKEDEIVLCSVVQAECLFGAKKIASQNLIAIYDTIFQTYSVFSFDSQSSQIFTDLKVKLTKTGKIIEDFDLMIASICLANNLILVTANTKHFVGISGLKLEDWSLE